MIKVKNNKVIANLAKRSFQSNPTRNCIAIFAIALTTMLFTTLFTITGTILHSYQQATFRQVGGDFHGGFKYITKEILDTLSKDPLIKESGARLILGMPADVPFHKAHVEVSYMDEVCVKSSFCIPDVGSLPKEGTNEMACDTRVLKLLGIEPKIGQQITITYRLGLDTNSAKSVTDTFTLSGWWNYDAASYASHIIVPLSYANNTLASYEKIHEKDKTGSWTLNVYLKNAAHIEDDLNTILERNGYQSKDQSTNNYIGIGINWAYVGAQLSQNIDAGTFILILLLLLLIIFTGYLIIYNIFQISVSNDIRFYGLLKTIGTTGKQMKKLILQQALLLSTLGIPIGLLLGYLCGNILAPVIMSTLSYKNVFVTTNPLIFAGAILFSLVTVFISCKKPGKIASKVSPIEAVRYTERTNVKKTNRKNKEHLNLFQMAFANLSRNISKTVLVVISLSLAVVLLQLTVLFTNGFDMEKYLQKNVVSDFIVANASYFQTNADFFSQETALPEEVIKDLEEQGTFTDSGRIYGATSNIKEFTEKDWYYQLHGKYNDKDTVTQMLEGEDTKEGLVTDDAQLYGMEKYPLDQLTVVEGDLSALYDSSQNAIAAVYHTDDYNVLEPDSHWAKVGDQVTLRYVDTMEYYDPQTGEVVTDITNVDEASLALRPSTYRDITYTVAACVTMRHSMSYRYYGTDAFVLNAKVFQKDSNTSGIMTYLYDTTKETNAAMEAFLKDYTENIEPTLDYESKQSYMDEFKEFKNMFLLLGSVLSAIVGFVGILNFLNAILTSIMARQREFAMLQSIGMTGKQLNQMLVFEGLIYTAFVIGISLILSLIMGPMFRKVLESILWFFTYRFTLLPIIVVTPIFILLGIVLPLVSYRFSSNHTIVERLRKSE
ncbi:ABC transporter permease [Candidatus Galacturonibacter soehngenii]|nr:ABC transporter permease [Candidatus Galacturonibacter soehngenii]